MKPTRTQSISFRLLVIALFFSFSLSTFSQQAEDPANEPATNEPITNEPATNEKEGRIYELRIYYPNEGKLQGILKRFREHTTTLFEKHGFTNVAYWVTRPNESPSYATKLTARNDGKESLLYIVSFPNMESRNRSWEAFVNDPEWIRVYEESRRDGPLVREIDQIFLDPTDFSILK